MANDIKKHVSADYLKQQFNIISKKLPQDIPEIEYWRNLMHKNQKLDTIFSSIVIPMVCTYSSKLFVTHSNETQQYLLDFKNECQSLHLEFNRLKTITNVEIILMLLPIPDKDELNTNLDKRLKAMQII